MQERTQHEALWVFREELYHLGFERRRDALAELVDALLVAGHVPAFVHLSLAELFRRGWGSAYDVLAAGRLNEPLLRELVSRYPLDDGAPMYALDTSIWPRCDAECSPERGFYHSSSRQSAGQPIVAGWSYAWLAQLSFTHESWTAPLDVRRVPVRGDAHAVAAAQIRELVGRQPADSPVPLCVFDAGYDLGTLAHDLGELDGTRVAVLVRVRGDRCFYAEPEPRASKIGRPRRHGAKFACKDANSWWPASAEHIELHHQYGQVRVRAWAGIHAKVQHRPTPGHRRRDWPILHGTLVLVEVERLPRQTRIPKQLWLWWRGPGQPDLAGAWRAYVRRFDLEHTYRFCKQTLWRPGSWSAHTTDRPASLAHTACRWSWAQVSPRGASIVATAFPWAPRFCTRPP